MVKERGGVLGAMDTMYQRGKIQEESMYYEQKKHDGSLAIIGVNTFLPEEGAEEIIEGRELARSSEVDKQIQVDNLEKFKELNRAHYQFASDKLKASALNRENVFEALMEASKYCTLGQMTEALYSVGGLYRRNM